MKDLFIVLLLTFAGMATHAQQTFTTSKDEQTGAVIYKGLVSFSELHNEATFSWLKKGEAAYKPDSNAVMFLKNELPAYHIITLMGTWCDDSQYLIPKLNKVLQAAAFPMKQYLMYGVDRAKQTGGIESQMYQLKKVPTIIIFKGNTEVGRITESVKRSIEADIAQIIELSAAHK